LDVLSRRDDGYHELDMIMQSVALYDEILLQKTQAGIEVCCSNSTVPQGQSNICYKAACRIFDLYDIKGGIKIQINKKIPIAAGLAGGSTDAAGVIEGINKLYDLGLDQQQMMELGKEIGSDVPFCIHKGTAIARGVGEKLEKLKNFNAWIVLAKPNISVSTATVFGDLKLGEIIKHPDTIKLIDYLEHEELELLAENMVNVLETVTIKKHPVIAEIKNIMLEFGAAGSLMSGSGPTVFGIFKDKISGEKCYHRLRDYLVEVYYVSTII
jgi:4-diphosphocytidyl-2-C-methyl-D-erythritol kinase